MKLTTEGLTVRRKLVAFGLVLAVTFGLGAAIGAAVGPIDVGPDHDAPAPISTEHGGH